MMPEPKASANTARSNIHFQDRRSFLRTATNGAVAALTLLFLKTDHQHPMYFSPFAPDLPVLPFLDTEREMQIVGEPHVRRSFADGPGW